MTRKLQPGDRVEIKAGDERGGWGIVRLIFGHDIHVGLYGALTADRVYSRPEVRKASK